MNLIRNSAPAGGAVIVFTAVLAAQPVLTQISPAHGGTALSLGITSATPGAGIWLGVGTELLDPPTPLFPFGSLHIGGTIAILPMGSTLATGVGAGSLNYYLPLPAEPLLTGWMFHLQALDLLAVAASAPAISEPRTLWYGPPDILDSPSPVGGILGGSFGWAVAVGDFLGTPDQDIAVSAVNEPVGGVGAGGRVYVFPGPSPWTVAPVLITSPSPSLSPLFFGWSMVAADWNGDGLTDLVVGEPAFDTPPAAYDVGRAVVFLHPVGSGGSVSLVAPSPLSGEGLGKSLAAGNLDGDPADEVVLGGGDGPSNQARRVVVFDFDGSIVPSAWNIYEPGSPSMSWAFGGSVAAGDADGVAPDEILVGDRTWQSPPFSGYGRCHLFTGGGGFLATISNPALSVFASGFGQSVAVGDLDGDGLGDLMIGTPGQNQAWVCPAPGFVPAIALPAVQPGDIGGGRSSLIADVNGDGHPDAVFGASSCLGGGGAYCAAVSFYLGPALAAKGFLAHTGSGVGAHGFDIAGGDLDGDGAADVVSGAPWSNPAPLLTGAGRAFLYR